MTPRTPVDVADHVDSIESKIAGTGDDGLEVLSAETRDLPTGVGDPFEELPSIERLPRRRLVCGDIADELFGHVGTGHDDQEEDAELIEHRFEVAQQIGCRGEVGSPDPHRHGGQGEDHPMGQCADQTEADGCFDDR